MSATPPRHPRLPPQQEALPRYLDALLRETWEVPTDTFEPVDLLPPAEVVSPDDAATAPMPATDASTPGPMPAGNVHTHAPVDPVASAAEAALALQLFQVAGLVLALPVTALAGRVDSVDLVAAGQDQPPWLRGRLCYPHGEIQVVDTAHWVLPPDRPRSPIPRHYPVLMIADGRWGLACDALGAVVTLDPSTVRWRSARTQRRWLAGMVGQPPCALLDAAQLTALFEEALAAARTAAS